jgi:hypothetical protein
MLVEQTVEVGVGRCSDTADRDSDPRAQGDAA